MSTRAIIAIPDNNGTLTGAWQWNDGGDDSIKRCLKRFNTPELARELVFHGAWSGMYGPIEKARFIKWANETIGGMRKSQSWITLSNNVSLLVEDFYDKEPKPYHCIDDALSEDINYVYVFDADKGTWNRYQ